MKSRRVCRASKNKNTRAMPIKAPENFIGMGVGRSRAASLVHQRAKTKPMPIIKKGSSAKNTGVGISQPKQRRSIKRSINKLKLMPP